MKLQNSNTIAAALAILIIPFMIGCGEEDLEAAQKELKETIVEIKNLELKRDSLEARVSKLDTTKKEIKRTLISTQTVSKKNFDHFIEVQGFAESKENILVSAEIGGAVRQVNVEEGQKVTKDQVLVKLDDKILMNNIAEINTMLDLAAVVYEKQRNLWDQQIGSELQYLQAKNQKETLERRLATLNAQLE
ncbi:MAG: biotin/lipoyl-binding protein, partial [Bacteroidetes bacterium]|nr:biotin/lipoyl-binding protein [Bacteroidota bacterium]